MKNEEHGSSREPSHTVGSPVRAQPIETAPKVDEQWLLLSTTGAIWFQSLWDEDFGWMTFNRYRERDKNLEGKPFNPRYWAPIPALTALVAEEQVAGSWSQEANETDWKARCEAAEQALEGMRDALTWVLPMAKGYAHAHPVGNNHGKIAAAEEVLNPTPQGGKP